LKAFNLKRYFWKEY